MRYYLHKQKLIKYSFCQNHFFTLGSISPSILGLEKTTIYQINYSSTTRVISTEASPLFFVSTLKCLLVNVYIDWWVLRSSNSIYLIQVENLVPYVCSEDGASIFGQDQESTQLSRSGDPWCLELWVVCWEVWLHQGSLALGLTVTRRKQVLGVIVVIHSLQGVLKEY